MFLDCSQSTNASQWLWRPVWFLQSPGITSRHVLPVHAFCMNWVQIVESKVVRLHAIHRNPLFCSGRMFVQKLTGSCCFQHEDLQNLGSSVQLIVTRIPIPSTVQFALHGISMEALESRSQLEPGSLRMLECSSPRLCSGRSKLRSPRPRPRRQGQMLRAHLHHQLELPQKCKWKHVKNNFHIFDEYQSIWSDLLSLLISFLNVRISHTSPSCANMPFVSMVLEKKMVSVHLPLSALEFASFLTPPPQQHPPCSQWPAWNCNDKECNWNFWERTFCWRLPCLSFDVLKNVFYVWYF